MINFASAISALSSASDQKYKGSASNGSISRFSGKIGGPLSRLQINDPEPTAVQSVGLSEPKKECNCG